MIHVNVTQVAYSNIGVAGSFVVFLKGVNDQRTLLVMIGRSEAEAIALLLENLKPPRPLAHDLFKNILDNLECRVKKACVHDLKNDIFYATLFLEKDGLDSEIDARPSDAVALAMRFSAPIYVSEEVMDRAGLIIPPDMEVGSKPESAVDTKTSKIEALQKQINKAIEEERYEDAARLRDEITKLTASN